MKKLLILASVAMISAASANAFPWKGKGKSFEKMDTNGDGVISKEEHLERSGAKFDKMDLNGDGQITKDERKEFVEKRKEKMKEKHEKMKEKRGHDSDDD